ncbi:BTAD domain-containing putative transcriptional regulator [Streptomyces sp. NPDC006632]|uniref:AfsR/SARP family transcriptional regulator n=1 Tax=Streptomyces sp. NPDC006632 TaxID=3157182 RepID=UPI0033BE9479
MRQIVFGLLGALDVRVDGVRVALGSARQRIVLTTLLLAADRVVSVGSLIDAVWQGDEPATARNQIAICVGALRKIFRDAAGTDELIVTSHPGYLLSLAEHRLDSREFEECASRARDAARRGRAAEASALMEQALGLWRGRALEGIEGEPAESAAARLEELRLDLREERAGLHLRLGRHRALVDELSALVRENPLREQARAFLMLAQYRSGHRAQALEVFREGRAVLVGQLGIEPGRALRSLHDLVLRDAPELGRPAATDTPPAPIGVVPSQLPANVAAFTGRMDQLARLDRMIEDSYGSRPLAVGVVAGVAGVGKTALAVHWANQAAARFPDGRLFIDLRGHDEKDDPVAPGAALDRLLRSLGVPGTQIPPDPADRAALYRSVLDTKRMLILLDNAGSYDQIQPLLPGAGRCCVLITSRTALDGLTGDYDVLRMTLPTLAQAEATALLAQVAGPGRFTADPVAAARLGELCDRLPLALRIAGARLAARPHWSLRSLVGRLEDQRRRLDELSPGQGGVRAGLRLSYRDLDPAAARMYRRLGLLTVPDFAAWVGACLLDTDLWEAEDLIEQLVDAQLLEVVSGPAGAPARYRFQDLLRLYAWELALAEESEQERAEALERAHGGWLALAEEAHRRMEGFGGLGAQQGSRRDLPASLVEELLAEPTEWFEAERAAIVGIVAQSAQSGQCAQAGQCVQAGQSGQSKQSRPSVVTVGAVGAAPSVGSARSTGPRFSWLLTAPATALFETRHYLEDWQTCAEQSLAAARRAGDRGGEAMMLRSLGSLAIHRRRYASAEESLEVALRLFENEGDESGAARVRRLLAICAHFRGDMESAYAHCRPAMEVLLRIGEVRSAIHSMGLLAQIETRRGNVTHAIELTERAVAKSREGGFWRAEAQSLHWLAEALLKAGRPGPAAGSSREAVALTRDGGDRVGETYALRLLGAILWRQGDLTQARRTLEQALAIAHELADDWLRGRIETDLGCTDLLAGRTGAAERFERARKAFEAVGAHAWVERTGQLIRLAGPDGAAPTAGRLTGILGE